MFGKGLSSNDIQALNQFNNQIKNGISYSQAYKNSLSNCSVAGKQMAVQIAKGKVSVDSLTNASKASAIGMGLLNAAMNFGIMMAVTGLIELGKYLWKLVPTTEHLKDQLEETAQSLADIRSEREGLNNELKTTEERIAELEAKGALSFTDEAELNRLRQENAELERKLILLDDEEKKEEEKYRKKFNKLIDGDRKTSEKGNYFSLYNAGEETTVQGVTSRQGVVISDIEYLKELGRAYHDAEMAADGYFTDARNGYRYSTEDIQKRIDNMSDDITDYQKYLSDLYENGFNYSTADEETKKNVDFVNEMIDTYMVVIGKTDSLWSQVYNRDRFAEAREAIEELAVSGKLSADSLQNLYNQGGNVKEFVDYMLSLETVDWETMLGDKFADVAGEDNMVSLDEALKAMSSDTELASKIMGLLANELNKVEEAAEGATSNIQTFSDVFKSIKEGTDVLADAYSDIEDGGEISLEHLMSLLDKYPDLVEYVNLENGQHNITIGILKAKFEAEKKAQLAKITASKSAVNAEIAEQKAILDTIATKKEKAKQDLAETMVSIGRFKTVGDALNAINARPGYYLRGFDWDVSDAKVAIADAEKQLKNLSAQEALIKNMSWEDITSGSGGKTAEEKRKEEIEKHKKEAEAEIAKLKYKLETNKITEEKYLKDLDSVYKSFYNKTADYLEDYAKYSQEVYDGFKDMYKEDLEAQKEAWEEKKDAVSEYYDNLREQIENAHDKEDYEKEQSEKRKEIFDLDMQIAELMRDGSEKAKARIAELEEERLKAEEELLDFENDKARKDELSRLEKEQEAEEKKIQDKIDGIQKKLDKLDEDTISIRNAIIAYAKEKGVTLNFAYASGTRSSVGGFGRINEKGIEMISAPDGNGNYIPMLPSSYVFSAKATEFLWKLATEHSLPQAMYNSIAKSIKTQSSTPSVNIAQPITITMGDVIIKGNADKQTVADIKKQQENTVRMVLQKIKELQK